MKWKYKLRWYIEIEFGFGREFDIFSKVIEVGMYLGLLYFQLAAFFLSISKYLGK